MAANRIDDKIRQLRTQVASLEQLLQAEKKASLKQPDKLKQALSNLRQSCESLELDLTSGEPSTLHISGQNRTEKLLAKRAAELETVAVVSTAASTIREVDRLLQEVVDLTKARFGLYHVYIYLLDETGNVLQLAAGAGDVGRQIVAQGWNIPAAHEQSSVARAARSAEGVIVNDVQAEPDWALYELLPEIRSELAVPMLMGERVLGVLHVLSDEVNRFSQEDIRVQLALAAQIAVALENANQYQETQAALAEVWQSQALLQTIIDAAPDWIFVKDQEYRYRLVNESYAASLRLSPEDFVGQNDLEIGFPEEIVKGNPAKGIRGFWADDREVMDSGLAKFIEVEPAVVDGQTVYLSTRRIPLRDTTGAVWGVLGFVQDISARRDTEELLAKRARELETVAVVSTAAATIRQVDRLLQEVANLTKERFGLYHTHIYVLDETGTTLELAAGAGEVGRQMVSEGWLIPLDREQSLVARAARTGQGVIVNDVRDDPTWLPNPLLPATRSEMAVPMLMGERVLGVLDMQSAEVNRFSEEDVRIKTALAAQIAVALENARLFAKQQQTSLLLGKRVKELNLLNEIGREIAETPAIPELLHWTTERIPPAMQYPDVCKAAIEYEGQVYGQAEAVALPCQTVHALRIQNGVVGRVYISYTEKRNFLDEESALISGIAGRISGYIESRRLFEQTQNALLEVEQSQQFLRTMLDNIPLPVFYKDVNGAYLGFNRAFLDYIGGSEEELLGKTVFDLNTDQTLAAKYHEMDMVLFRKPGTQVYETSVKYADGSLHNVIFNKATFTKPDGSLGGLVGTIVDITERKQAERALMKRAAELGCLNEIGHEMELAPPVPELLQRVTEQIPPAMQYPELCLVAIEYDGQIYGVPEAIGLPAQMTHGLYIGSEIMGRIYIAYTEKYDFLDEESALLGAVATRVSGYIENRRLFDQAQARARREQILRQVSDRIRSSVDVEIIMRTAAREVGQALGRPAFVYLGDGDSFKQPSHDEKKDV